MKTIFRLLCGWMAIALAACTGDELQQIEPLQKPVAQKTISVKAYTPSEQAATRLDFTEENDGSLSLAWSADDAFTAVIDGEKVTFTYNESSKEFTADVNENFELSNGTIAYYPAYDGENFEMDLSQQTGQLNGATTYMEGVYSNGAFRFTHSTAILKATFSGLPQEAEVASIKIGAAPYTISILPTDGMYLAEGGIYIYLPNVAKNENVVFSVSTTAGEVYTATQAVVLDEGIKVGTYYVAPIALTPAACNLPTGNDFNTALNSFLQGKDLTQITFIANSVNTDNSNPIGSSNAYMVANGNVLEIHTAAPKFVFNENCSGMFSYLTNIQSIDFGNCVNTSNVVNMDDMFNSCSSLTSLDLSSFNTANVEAMSSMFSYCQNLTSLDVSSFNTANVIFMYDMFNNCSSLTSLNVSSFNTANVEAMSSMFNGCSALSSLDLSSFEFNGVENRGDEHFSQMFYCLGESAAHRPIPVYVTLAGYEILSKKSMTGIDDSYAQLVALCELPTGNSFNSAVKSFLSENSSLTKIKFVANSSNTNTSKPISSISGAYMVAGSDNETLEIHTSAAGFLFNEDCNHMFSSLSAITAINFNNSVNTAKVTNMAYMFYNCRSLSSLNVGNFNTSNVTNMSYMFSQCETLTSLNVSSFNTSKVTNMCDMFCSCSSLTSLNVSNFNTSNVTNMSYMFSHCETLTSLNVSSFNTSNVTNMASMFSGCQNLTSLNVSSFNTANVIFMNGMFNHCSALTSLDLSSFNTANVEDMVHMFNFCSSLTSLDLSNFNTEKVTSMASMFYFCPNISELDLSSFVFKENVILTGMFTNLGSEVTNKPISVYVKNENDKDLLESKSTGIDSNYAQIVVKQP